jgi:hypothetical protein
MRRLKRMPWKRRALAWKMLIEYQNRAQNFEYERTPEVYVTRLLVVSLSTIAAMSQMAAFYFTCGHFVGTTTIHCQMVIG